MSPKVSKSLPSKTLGWPKLLPWLMFIGGLIAVGASFALTMEKFDLLKNPNYSPSCDLNPILSCSSVTNTNQAEVFGFPNPFLGLAGYAAVATVGLALLAGARFKPWFWRLNLAGLLAATIFITWLQFQTLYRIGALCVFCMIVWAVTIPIFWYNSLYSLQQGHVSLPKKWDRAVAFASRHHAEILTIWLGAIVLLILKRFWYYWSSLL